MAMRPEQLRDIFDAILEDEIAALPKHAAAVVSESGVIVEDEPPTEVLRGLGMKHEEGRGLCGMHHGVAYTDRSVEDTGELPSQIMLFRGPIIRLAGYSWRADVEINREKLIEQVRITLLHEIGHQFGLDEDDLAELGYD